MTRTNKQRHMHKQDKYAKDATNHMKIVHDGKKQAMQETQK